jgi:hypothetical protein
VAPSLRGQFYKREVGRSLRYVQAPGISFFPVGTKTRLKTVLWCWLPLTEGTNYTNWTLLEDKINLLNQYYLCTHFQRDAVPTHLCKQWS